MTNEIYLRKVELYDKVLDKILDIKEKWMYYNDIAKELWVTNAWLSRFVNGKVEAETRTLIKINLKLLKL